MPEEAVWQSIARRKKEEQASKIPKEWLLRSHPATHQTNVLNVPGECGMLTAREVQITERYDATDLVLNLRSGKLKSVDVVTAFCKRAAIAQQLVSLTSVTISSSW